MRLIHPSIRCSRFTTLPYNAPTVTDLHRLLTARSREVERKWLLHKSSFRSSSSSRWRNRQGRDKLASAAKVQGLKSRAAYKLLEINERYKLFRSGQTVVDLGYAPGSWSQVAVDRTSPNGRVIGIDVIPAQPPKGVSTIQGNFLSRAVQDEVKNFLRSSDRGRPYLGPESASVNSTVQFSGAAVECPLTDYFESEKNIEAKFHTFGDQGHGDRHAEDNQYDPLAMRIVDIVLSDMSAPWEMVDGFWKRSLSDPYFRMMNTSGINFRDHAGSMDLCNAALKFGFETLRVGGHFVCKFYQGAEDKKFELRLRALFSKVHKEKPESSRSESREAYFVALRRKANIKEGQVFDDIQ